MIKLEWGDATRHVPTAIHHSSAVFKQSQVNKQFYIETLLGSIYIACHEGWSHPFTIFGKGKLIRTFRGEQTLMNQRRRNSNSVIIM